MVGVAVWVEETGEIVSDFAHVSFTATSSERIDDSHALVPGVGKLVLDAEDAHLVFALPVLKGDDPASAPEVVQRPMEEAAKIFLVELGDFATTSPSTDIEVSEAGAAGMNIKSAPMLENDYRKSVQELLKKVMEKDVGLDIHDFTSVDNDVVFWKISAKHALLQKLAEKFEYTMAYSSKAYENVRKSFHQSQLIVPDVEGDQVRAYSSYREIASEDFEEFLSKDAIRLVMLELSRYVNVNELTKQGVLERWFPVGTYDEMKKLNDGVLGWPFSQERPPLFPQSQGADQLRSYFGSEIGLFFNFYGELIKSMVLPAFLGLAIWILRNTSYVHLSIYQLNTLQTIFGAVVTIWGIVFVSSAQHSATLAKTRWGAHIHSEAEVRIADYQPKVHDPVKQRLLSLLGRSLTWIFLCFVIGTCVFVSLKVKDHTMSSILQTLMTFAFSSVWGKIAYRIVQLENKRTMSEFNKSLTMRLSFVKLFIFFFPLGNLAFLAPVSGRQCGNSMEEAAALLFRNGSQTSFRHNNDAVSITSSSDPIFLDWAENNLISLKRTPVEYALMKLTTVHLWGKGASNTNEMCLKECYPSICEVDDGILKCTTSCYLAVDKAARTLYISHLVSMIVSMIVPSVLVLREVKAEMAKSEKSAKSKDTYTLIQYEEKRSKIASYAYESYGGSYVEDFLNVILSFALLVTFWSVSPLMSLVGLVANLFEYRLLVYRMTWITCRPFPAGTAGIDEWIAVLDVVMYSAVCMSSLLLICVLSTDLKRQSSTLQIGVAGAMVLALFAVKVLLGVALHERPIDIATVIDQNRDFKDAYEVVKYRENRSAKASAPGASIPA